MTPNGNGTSGLFRKGLVQIPAIAGAQSILSGSAPVCLIIATPFVLFHWMLPFVTPYTLGNDYWSFSVHHQLEMLFSLRHGSFPLFIPGLQGGQTSAVLMLGQVFHPLPHIASWFPGYWDGNALSWLTALKLVSLAAVHLMLYRWLRLLRLQRGCALVFSLVTVYNLRMLDLFRYNASLEAWTGFLALVALMGTEYLRPRKKTGTLVVAAASYWFITSGHLQMIHHCAVGLAVMVAVIPFFSDVLLARPTGYREKTRFWMRMGIGLCTGVLLSAAMWLPVYFDFMRENAGRVGQGYAFADGYRDSFAGTVNNFFRPLHSDVHGSFGGNPFFLVALLAPLLRLAGIRLNKCIWALWIAVAVTFVYMQGARTPLHYLAWNYVPFLSSVRIAGRASVILPPLLMMILAWVVSLPACSVKGPGGRAIRPWAFLVCLAAGLLVLYAFIPGSLTSAQSETSPARLRTIPGYVEALLGGAGLLALILSAGIQYRKNRHLVTVVLYGLLLLQGRYLMKYGTWVDVAQPSKTWEEMKASKARTVNFVGAEGAFLHSRQVARHLEHFGLEPKLARLYEQWRFAHTSDAAYSLLAERIPEIAVVEGPQCRSSFSSTDATSSIALTYSSSNRLVFAITASDSLLAVISYPFSSKWSAAVNGQPHNLCRANGMYIGCVVGKGVHELDLRYTSRAAKTGMLISIVALVVVALVALYRPPRPVRSCLFAVVAVSGAAVMYAFWHAGLHKGDCFGTVYQWTTPAKGHSRNMARGARGALSSHAATNYLHHYHPQNAVNGDTAWRSGIVTEKEQSPWYCVTLYAPVQPDSIRLYLAPGDSTTNRLPLTLRLFSSREQHSDMTIFAIPPARPLTLAVSGEECVHKITISASGMSRLAIDEFELWGTACPQAADVVNDTPSVSVSGFQKQ